MNMRKLIVIAGIVFAQLVMTQVVTFIVSLALPEMETMAATQTGTFVVIVGITFTVAITLVGWFALRQSWLTSKPRFPLRVLATLIGAYLPMVIALILVKTLVAGDPVFSISILTGIVGFYIPGWFDKSN